MSISRKDRILRVVRLWGMLARFSHRGIGPIHVTGVVAEPILKRRPAGEACARG